MPISGLKFPLEITGAGRFSVIEEDNKLQQNIERITNTSIKERFMEPNMGTVGYSLLFRNVTSNSVSTAAKLIQDAIVEQEPRVVSSVQPLGTEDKNGNSRLAVSVQYIRKDKKEVNIFNVEVGE